MSGLAAGELQAGWRTVKFGDVVRNADVQERDPLENGIERFVGLEHLEPGSLHIREWGNVAEGTTFTRKFKPGQVLFGKRRAYQRKVSLAEFEGICSGDILVFEAIEDHLLPELLPFIVESDGFFEYALRTSAGSLSPRTKWKELAEYAFHLPPKEEQRRIADILWAADAAVERWREVVAQLRALERAQSGRSFFAGGEGPVESCRQLCDEVTVGIVVKPASFYTPRGGVPALRSLNIFPSGFVLDDVVMLSEQGHSLHAKSQLKQGDVVIVRTGRPGDAAVVPADMVGWNCIDAIVARPGPRLLPGFLAAFLNSSTGRAAIGRGAAGTAQQHFNVAALNRLQIPCPSLADQQHILEALTQIQEARSLADNQALRVSETNVAAREALLMGAGFDV